MDRAAARAAGLLRLRHRPGPGGADDFEVQNTARIVALQRQTLALLETVTLGLAALTLAAGGAGVLVSMWLSVSDRTAEIGLRRAVGATPARILVQFLGEAALLAAIGWSAGLAVGGLVVVGLGWATRWTLALPLEAVAISFGMAALAAVGPGAIPALRAARVAPVEALRGA